MVCVSRAMFSINAATFLRISETVWKNTLLMHPILAISKVPPPGSMLGYTVVKKPIQGALYDLPERVEVISHDEYEHYPLP